MTIAERQVKTREAKKKALRTIQDILRSAHRVDDRNAFRALALLVKTCETTLAAARAYREILEVSGNTGVDASAVKAAMRDVVVLQCSLEADPADKLVYDEKLRQATESVLEIEPDV